MSEIPDKKKVGDDPNHLDLLSNLPLCIIHNILTFVPIREAVRTCVLSTQWRYTWVTLPNLVFDDEEDYSDFISKDNFGELMENLITNVLLCHKGPIYKFQISVPFSPSSETMDQWIQCLSMNDIRELIIDLTYEDDDDDDWFSDVRLPSSIYSCEKLTYLRIHNCELVRPPSSFNGFLFLRGLNLHAVQLYPRSSGKIGKLFRKSALLEDLSVTDCGCLKLWIHSPSLKYMILSGNFIKMSLHAPLLAVMNITLLSGGFKVGGGKNYECNFTHFLGRCTDLEKLNLRFKTVEYLSLDIVSSHRSLVFPRLKDIVLDVNFNLLRRALVAARIVVGSPNLEKLRIFCPTIRERDHLNLTHEKVSVMDFQSALNSTFEKLRVFSMVFVNGCLLEMEFIKYLLENSPVLEVATFLLLSERPGDTKQSLREVLLSYTCASPVAKITVTTTSDPPTTS